MKTAIALALLFSMGCYRTEIRGGGVLDTAGVHSSIANHYVFGIVNAKFDVNNCRYGIANAKTWKPWYSAVVSLFTLGMVSPQRLKYSCVAAPAPAAPVVVQMVAPSAPVASAAPVASSPHP